jgi:hypothetical protein
MSRIVDAGRPAARRRRVQVAHLRDELAHVLAPAPDAAW